MTKSRNTDVLKWRKAPASVIIDYSFSLLEVGEDFLFFDGAVDISQVIAKRVTRVGGSLLKVTGEVQLCAQRASGFDRFRLLPFPSPNFPGG